MALVARIFVVLFAFALACLAAAVVTTFALLFPGSIELLDVDQQIVAVTVGLSAVFFSLYAMLPAMVIIALAEGFRLRSVLFYALAGRRSRWVWRTGGICGPCATPMTTSVRAAPKSWRRPVSSPASSTGRSPARSAGAWRGPPITIKAGPSISTPK